MKLGFGLYAHQLDRDNYRFARQCGATHLVIHLVDYFYSGQEDNRDNQPVGSSGGWGIAGRNLKLWEPENLRRIVTEAAQEGLEVAAVENFDPVDWYDVLLGGPRRDIQLTTLKSRIRDCAEAGIPCIGYNFSLAGVSSRITGEFARGAAASVGMDGIDDSPIPQGMIWNMTYNQELLERSVTSGDVQPVLSEEELWDNHRYFLETLLPVAESAGVMLAAHPDDPPVELVRGQPRLVWRPELYDRLIDSVSSPMNRLELCLGTLAEMPGHKLEDTLSHYLKRDAVGYIHFRNVRGHAPQYRETFIDEGDIDMARILEIIHESGWDGVLIPDHTPQMSCLAPWHAGMAYAMGYIKSLMDQLNKRMPDA